MALGALTLGRPRGCVGLARLAGRGTVPGALGSVTAGWLPSPGAHLLTQTLDGTLRTLRTEFKVSLGTLRRACFDDRKIH